MKIIQITGALNQDEEVINGLDEDGNLYYWGKKDNKTGWIFLKDEINNQII